MILRATNRIQLLAELPAANITSSWDHFLSREGEAGEDVDTVYLSDLDGVVPDQDEQGRRHVVPAVLLDDCSRDAMQA